MISCVRSGASAISLTTVKKAKSIMKAIRLWTNNPLEIMYRRERIRELREQEEKRKMLNKPDTEYLNVLRRLGALRAEEVCQVLKLDSFEIVRTTLERLVSWRLVNKLEDGRYAARI